MCEAVVTYGLFKSCLEKSLFEEMFEVHFGGKFCVRVVLKVCRTISGNKQNNLVVIQLCELYQNFFLACIFLKLWYIDLLYVALFMPLIAFMKSQTAGSQL